MRRLNRSVALPVVLLATLAIVLLAQTLYLLSEMTRINSADQTVAQIFGLEEKITNMETGLRGYLITDQPDFLNSYNAGRITAGQNFDKLSSVGADDPHMEPLVRAIQSDFEGWMQYATKVLSLHDTGGPFREYSSSGAGTRLIDRVRANLTALAQDQLAHRYSLSRRAAQGSRLVVVTGVVLTLLLGLWIVAFIRRQFLAVCAKALDEVQQAADSLRQSEERYRLLVANIPDLTWTADCNHKFQFLSTNAERLLGYAPNEVLSSGGEFWFGRIHAEDLRVVKEEYGALFASGRPFDLEYRFRRKDGAWTWLHDRAIATFRDDKCRHAVGVCSDVTERKDLESKLLQAQKMDAIGRLAGGVAHDFNNLLTAIIGYSDLLLSFVDEDDPKREMIQAVRKAGESAASLTRQLLAFSRRQVLQLQVFDLRDAVESTKKMLTRLIGEDIALETSTGNEPLFVKADRGQVEQVIVNLVVNARDAMPGGGRIKIETAAVSLEYDRRPEAGPGEGRFARLSVSDTGPGIDPEIRAHLFEPFFTTKEVGKGTGLGLSTVYGIVTQSGGVCEAESEQDSGATVSVYLPLSGPPETSESASNIAKEPKGGSELVLLVEDNREVRHFSRSVLESRGYRVIAFEGGEEALEACKNLAGQTPDIVITDAVMPVMSGPELVEKLLKNWPRLRVLYMSGYTNEIRIRHGLVAQNIAFLQKPFTPDQLANKVREVLDLSA